MDLQRRQLIMELLEDADIADEPTRLNRPKLDPFELSDREFQRTFRLNKELVENLIYIVDEFSEPVGRKSDLDTETKVFAALRFFAGGSYQLDVGDNCCISISQPSVSRSIRDITTILNHPAIFNEWVHFPRNLHELNFVRARFYEQFGFPGVVGCVDCTHVAIFPPKNLDPLYPEHVYVNRKGYHSLNVQLICDAKMKILNVNARYPGSSHDSFIWEHCNVLPAMRDLHARNFDDFYLLGDSGYSLRPWLLTPLLHAEPDSPEERYNTRFTYTRSIIERCNGLLKIRFRCLLKHRVLHYAPSTAAKIVNSCTVLHNMCLQANVPEPEIENDYDFGIYNHQPIQANPLVQDERVARVNPDLAKARLIQQQIIRNHFWH